HRRLWRVVRQQWHELRCPLSPSEGINKAVPRDGREPIPKLGFNSELALAAHNLGHRYLKQVAGEILVATGQQQQISEKAVAVAFVEFFERCLVTVRHAHR